MYNKGEIFPTSLLWVGFQNILNLLIITTT